MRPKPPPDRHSRSAYVNVTDFARALYDRRKLQQERAEQVLQC